MAILQAITDTAAKTKDFTQRAGWVGALLVRVSVGLMFFVSGKGKLGNLEGVTGFFESLGIPAPGFHAALVAYVEMLGGLALALGLLTRVAAIPLVVVMIVAMATGGAFDSDQKITAMDVITKSDFTYMAAMIWLALTGPGKASLDAFIGSIVQKKRGAATPQRAADSAAA